MPTPADLASAERTVRVLAMDRELREARARIAVLTRSLDRERKRADAWEREADVLREALTDALDAAKQPPCSECGGSRVCRDEERVGGRDWMGVRSVKVDCEACLMTGRELA